jgi:tetratricopeptide (TPR) repeat protein
MPERFSFSRIRLSRSRVLHCLAPSHYFLIDTAVPSVSVASDVQRRARTPRSVHARTSAVRACRILVCSAALWFAPAAPGQIAPSPQAGENNSFDTLAKSATAEREAGKTDRAIADYQRALQLRPDWQEGWFYLGTLQYDADRYAQAIPAFRKLVELAPAIGPAWNFLGLCEFETRDYANSLLHLEKGQKLGAGDDPEIAQVSQYHLALLLNRNGDFDRATTTLISAFGEAQFPAQAKLALGLALLHAPVLPGELNPSQDALVHAAGEVAAQLAKGDSASALDAFPKLLKDYPDTPYLHAAYAKALAAAGRNQEALDQQREESRVSKTLGPVKAQRDDRMAQIYAGPSTAPDTTNAGAADALWAHAMTAYSNGKYSETIAAIKIWIERRPSERKVNDGTAWAVMGLSEFALNDYDNALIHLQRGQDLGLGGSTEAVRLARYHLAILLNRNAQYESASRLLAPEANSDSPSAEIQLALGIALLRLPLLPQQVPPSQQPLVQSTGEIAILLQDSKYEQAFPKLQQLLKQYPATPFLHYAYALGLASLSQYDEAEPQLREESRISPASELPHILLASIALKKHDAAGALSDAERAVQLAPQSAKAHYVLGRAYLELNQDDKAVRELETANKINPGSPEVHFNLARAYAKAKLPEKAQEERATFARLNAQAEQQRSQFINQSYGASANSMDLSPAQSPSPKSANPEKN